jgi:hypothetical protein
MKIKSVAAYWVHLPIAQERQHTSDFGRTLSERPGLGVTVREDFLAAHAVRA